MKTPGRGLLVSIAILLGACRPAPPTSFPSPSSPASAQPDTPETSELHTTRFYAARPYGSETEFNPLSLIVNGGYDQLRTSPTRPIFKVEYRRAFGTIWNSVTHPDAVIRHYGVGRWLRNEVFPLSLKGDGGGQWYPNYYLHLFGGGATYVETVEWYEHENVAHPELAAGFTVYAWHLLTEMVENGGHCCEDEDGLTDLAIFDAASIVLWNQGWMQRPFGGALEFKTWMGQASLSAPGKTLEDAYMGAMIRTPLPFTSNWKLLNTFGNAFLLGPSRRIGGDYWLSVTAGFDPVDNPVIDPVTNAKTVTLKPNAGLFFDRQGSLLASLIFKGGSTNGATLNVYPLARSSPGLWVQQVRGGGVRFGVVSPLGLGVGWLAR